MSQPAEPIKPGNIAEAFAAADAAAAMPPAAPADAEAEARQKRADDEAFFLTTWRKNPGRGLQVGKAMGFTQDELDQIAAAAQLNDRAKRARLSARAKDGQPASRAPGGDRPGGQPGDAPQDPDAAPGFVRTKIPVKPLPADCPVVPLGRTGMVYHFLNPSRSLVSMAKGSFSAEGLRLLFGECIDWLWVHFPKFNESTARQSGWKMDQAAETLVTAAAQLGEIDVAELVRGLGGWKDETGGLVLHCGDKVLFEGKWHKPGKHGEHIYPAYRPSPKPADPLPEGEAGQERQRADRRAINELLTKLDSWNWHDDGTGGEGKGGIGASVDGSGHALASLLVLGWMAAARGGGALRYRPILWLTGDRGTGKSTLQELLEGVLRSDMVQSSDATPAAIWQTLGQSTRAVAIDEAENDPSSPKMQNMVKLARQAATGGFIMRGSNSHQATGFEAKSAFLFSSIIVPSMPSQDMSRMAILELDPLQNGAALKLDSAELAHCGRVIARRLIDGWNRWPETFERYRYALAEQGHSARGCDQFGTLLAMADLMRFDALADHESIGMLASALSRNKIDEAQYEPSNAEAMLNFLTSVPLDVFRGGTRMTIGDLVTYAAGLKLHEDAAVATAQSCREALRAWGVFVEGAPGAARVTLPNQSRGLQKLFDDTQWGSLAGASGGWAQAMRRLPSVKSENSRRLGGRGYSVPAKVFLQLEAEE
jgi:energy-coupling factor transporter ATP-binding protein EcfA2